MNSREYYELFRFLMEQYCLFPEDIVFVESIADWCREQGIPEPDKEKPLKLIAKQGSGCMILIQEFISDTAMKARMNALSIRSQLINVAVDRSSSLDSNKKKLAYLFLREYATSLPNVQDELQADDWAFTEMERQGFFKQ